MSTISNSRLEVLIRAELVGPDPDPVQIAQRLAASLPDESVHSVLVNALVSRVRSTMAHFHRVRQSGESVPDNLSFEGQRLRVAQGRWKFLADCNSAELRGAAARLRKSATAMIDDANRIAARADALDRCNARTSRELGFTTSVEVA